MNNDEIRQEIDSINKKLDIILEEIELQRRHRREIEDLKEDLTRVGKDLYQTAVTELEDVHDYINTGDILYLGKKILRNVNAITKTFEQLESIRDFFQDATPLVRESFIDFMNKLDEFDRKGYFVFMKELGKVADKVVTSFKEEDLKYLGDNIVMAINILNKALSVYKNLEEVPEKVSLISLIKELNTPEVKRSLAYTIKFLKTFLSQEGK